MILRLGCRFAAEPFIYKSNKQFSEFFLLIQKLNIYFWKTVKIWKQNADIRFTALFTAKPHIFVSRTNPLARLEIVTLDDLKKYPRLTYEQGEKNSFYFSEELHSTVESYKNIIVSDRATLFNLLIGLDGYTISSGVLSSDLNGNQIVSIPLESDERMEIGYINSINKPLNSITLRYIEHLKNIFRTTKVWYEI